MSVQPSENWNLVQVYGSYGDSQGNPLSGFINFTARVPRWRDLTQKITIINTPFRVPLVGGVFSVNLPATNDPDITPTGFTYTVREEITNGLTYDITVPIGPPIDLILKQQEAVSLGAQPTPVTRAEFDALYSLVTGPWVLDAGSP